MHALKASAIVAALILAAAVSPLTAPKAEARTHFTVGVGIGLGSPVYAVPAYVPPPVYYSPAPVYVPPPPAYAYVPPAVVVEPPVTYYTAPRYYVPPPVYTRPVYW